MNRSIGAAVLISLGCIACMGQAVCAAEDAQQAPTPQKIKVVILVGGHPFDQPTFDKLWAGYSDFLCETWKGSPYSIFDDVSKFPFDVIVMYNLSSGMTDTQKKNFQKLLDKGVGLVVWHHALANCQDWPEFEQIAGAKFWLPRGEQNKTQDPESGVGFGKVKMHIEDPNHPITAGVKDFEIEDELYNHQTFRKDIHVIVSADHPSSDKTIAWVHRYGKARVFGYQSGHDVKTWASDSFRTLMDRGIRWAAGRLPDGK